eukprot:CAMPEP_0197642920 /NCGR_PEP_ID=MMETSP1338-20131121/16424_1 /TAXON_ID=43686 ORGANISM="Pelagodinium beii, Strain RCC1491" /NCGR_SAMPLE_ID=MMETSP1338 /ASSEMBLY_ACC=CAM_ASM_000754 /LENGTH=414 /DNA_ID=CAMNT_0043216109 /DNA_START=40 /DNA_END=1284 /DNA_ORIENTATION=+
MSEEKHNPREDELFMITIIRMNGIPLAKMKVHPEQTVGELTHAIKVAAQATELDLLLAFDSEVLDVDEMLHEAGLYEGCSVTAIRFPELFIAATYDDGVTKIWSAESGECERTLAGSVDAAVTAVSFAPTGLSLILGCMDGAVGLWSVPTGNLIREYQGHGAPIFAVAASPNGKLMATGSSDRTAMVWDFNTGRCLKVFNGHRGSINCLAFAPDSKSVGSGSEDATLKLWSVDGKTRDINMSGHQGSIQAVAFSPQGKALSSGSLDGNVKVWSVKGHLDWSLPSPGCSVCALGYSPDGMNLAVGGTDGNCRIWSVGTGSNILTIECNFGYPGNIKSVAFSPAGTLLATGSQDGSLNIWSSQTGQLKHQMQAHVPDGQLRPSGVFAVAFSAGPVPPQPGARLNQKKKANQMSSVN